MVPSESVDVPPLSVAVFTGSVIAISVPALATGATFGFSGSGRTVTVIWSSPVASALSVTLSLKIYIPSTRLLIVAMAVVALVIVDPAGPESFVHWYALMDPSSSAEPDPSRLVEFLGSVMLKFTPARAIGVLFGAGGCGLTVTVTWSSDTPPLLSVTFNLKTYTPSTSEFRV